MEDFRARYIFPNDKKSSMKMLYLNSYQNYNMTICLSLCFLWSGSLLMMTSYTGYGLLLIAICILSFYNGYRNLRIATNDFIKRHQFYPEYSNGKTITFSDNIYINDSSNYKIKEYRYPDIEYLIESKELFIIKFKFNAYIHIYKDDFTMGNSHELKIFLDRKNHSHKYIFVKYLISKNTLWFIIALIISSIILLLF